MRDLLSRPDGPWRGFLQGAGATALAVGLPVLLGTIFRAWSTAGWRAVGVALALAGAMSLIAGVGLAIWRAVQCWAYDRFTEGP